MKHEPSPAQLRMLRDIADCDGAALPTHGGYSNATLRVLRRLGLIEQQGWAIPKEFRGAICTVTIAGWRALGVVK